MSSLFALVDHILLAEFDIDRGASLSLQYPHPTGTDPHTLAEFMLPDGAHLREEDWTMFFLNQPATQTTVPATAGARLSDQRVSMSLDELPASTVPVTAYAYNCSTNEWSTFGQSPSAHLQFDGNCSIWDRGHSAKLAEAEPARMEFWHVRPLCTYLFVDDIIWGVRFELQDDEIAFLQSTNIRVKSLQSYDDLPPPPPMDSSNKSLLYVLNLVRTKHISGVRRGARVKAMAISSRYQFVHVFKPLLVLALDKFFIDPSIDILKNLYASINAIDISPLPLLSTKEKKILRSSEDDSLLKQHPVGASQWSSATGDAGRSTSGISSWSSLTTVEDKGSIPRSESTNSAPAIAQVANLMTSRKTNKDRLFFETKVPYDEIQVPIRIPLALFPEEVGDFSAAKLVIKFGHPLALHLSPQVPLKDAPPLGTPQATNGSSFCWHPHLDNGPSTHPIVLLLNALLTGKRILFLGDKRPSGEVANYVLAACALAGGGGSILRGFTERCFPYVSLASLDSLLAVPGYVAGVTNPVFEEQPSWWDVLCNINTGKIAVSSRLATTSPQQGPDITQDKGWYPSGGWDNNNEFMQETVMAAQGYTGEFFIRQRFHDYVQRFIDVAAALELEKYQITKIGVMAHNVEQPELGFGTFFTDTAARKREMSALESKIEAWRKTQSYKYCQQDHLLYLTRRVITCIDVRHIITALRSGSNLPEATVTQVCLVLQDTLTGGHPDAVLELLSLLPQTQGGLLPIAVGLFHTRWEVRRACVRLMRRIGYDLIGTKFVSHLNFFTLEAYWRLLREFYGEEVLASARKPVGTLVHGDEDGRNSVQSVAPRVWTASEDKSPSIGSKWEWSGIPQSGLERESSSALTMQQHSQPASSTLLSIPSIVVYSRDESPQRNPKTSTPSSPVVRRILQQQQQIQQQVKAKMTALSSEKGVFVEDIMNPDFGKDVEKRGLATALDGSRVDRAKGQGAETFPNAIPSGYGAVQSTMKEGGNHRTSGLYGPRDPSLPKASASEGAGQVSTSPIRASQADVINTFTVNLLQHNMVLKTDPLAIATASMKENAEVIHLGNTSVQSRHGLPNESTPLPPKRVESMPNERSPKPILAEHSSICPAPDINSNTSLEGAYEVTKHQERTGIATKFNADVLENESSAVRDGIGRFNGMTNAANEQIASQEDEDLQYDELMDLYGDIYEGSSEVA